MHSTSLLGLLKEQKGKIYKTSYLRLRLMPSAEGLIFQNANFGFGLMSKIRLRSYSGLVCKKGGEIKLREKRRGVEWEKGKGRGKGDEHT